ncbi:hypothetical protein FACS189485_05220 [Spirochaetia bacterium]|nr:hypothetical protein FACS189485_05220 [Spirochaetia bacterium]
MAFCINCGSQNPDNVKFCTSCGKPLGGGGASPAGQPSASKVGNVRKCPACGAALESFQSRCPSCGHELNSVKASGSVQAFVKQLGKAGSYAEQRQIIESFPIPNSKEDIFEFAILAVTKIKPDASGSKTNSAWTTKLKQVYLKAQMVFAEDKDSMEKFQTLLNEAEAAADKFPTRSGKAETKPGIIKFIIILGVIGVVLYVWHNFL